MGKLRGGGTYGNGAPSETVALFFAAARSNPYDPLGFPACTSWQRRFTSITLAERDGS